MEECVGSYEEKLPTCLQQAIMRYSAAPTYFAIESIFIPAA